MQTTNEWIRKYKRSVNEALGDISHATDNR